MSLENLPCVSQPITVAWIGAPHVFHVMDHLGWYDYIIHHHVSIRWLDKHDPTFRQLQKAYREIPKKYKEKKEGTIINDKRNEMEETTAIKL